MSIDTIYINSSIFNDTDDYIPCEYDTTFTSDVVSNAGQYYLAIDRFSIPNSNPIFTFKPNKYYITLTHNNIDYQVPLVMQSRNQRRPNAIFTFQHFIDIINTAWNTASTNLQAAFPSDTPYMTYNNASDTISLFTPQSYENTVDVYFNHSLYNFFENSFDVEILSTNSPNNKDIRFIIQSHQDNQVNTFYEFRQQIEPQ